MTETPQELIARLRRYSEPTDSIKVRDVLDKAATAAADWIEAAFADNAKLRETLDAISDRHIPDQPAASIGDDYMWVVRQYAELRRIARAALEETK